MNRHHARVQEAFEKTRRLPEESLLSRDAIERGIVYRLLEALGWDVFDPQTVAPCEKVDLSTVDVVLQSRSLSADSVFTTDNTLRLKKKGWSSGNV